MHSPEQDNQEENIIEVLQDVADSVIAAPNKNASEAQIAITGNETENESLILSPNLMLDMVDIETDLDRLTVNCTDVKDDEIDEIKRQLHANMVLLDKSALGLSAIQIGIPKRAFVIKVINKDRPMRRKLSFDEKYNLIYFINPEIIFSQYPRHMVESCLSIPREKFRVERCSRVRITDDLNGEQMFKNKLAHVVQHEFDHTRGITLYQSGNQEIVQVDDNARVDIGFLSERERQSLFETTGRLDYGT